MKNNPVIHSQSDSKKILPTFTHSNSFKTLLIHSCCGPCSSAVLEKLLPFFDITVYFYNPNIDNLQEFEKRFEEQERLIAELAPRVKLIKGEFNNDNFEKAIDGYQYLGERSQRCYQCYLERLEKSAEFAALNNFDYFTTTLSISPYKNSDWINEIGLRLEEKYHLNFLYSNFKLEDGYKRSVELSKKYNLYRQDYCGCKYSYQEMLVRKKLKEEVK